jgi:hypothetical protein
MNRFEKDATDSELMVRDGVAKVLSNFISMQEGQTQDSEMRLKEIEKDKSIAASILATNKQLQQRRAVLRDSVVKAAQNFLATAKKGMKRLQKTRDRIGGTGGDSLKGQFAAARTDLKEKARGELESLFRTVRLQTEDMASAMQEWSEPEQARLQKMLVAMGVKSSAAEAESSVHEFVTASLPVAFKNLVDKAAEGSQMPIALLEKIDDSMREFTARIDEQTKSAAAEKRAFISNAVAKVKEDHGKAVGIADSAYADEVDATERQAQSVDASSQLTWARADEAGDRLSQSHSPTKILT